MLVDAIIATVGAAVLLPLTFAGLIATRGRRSEELLVAPRGARFGDATGLIREAVREAAREAREQQARTEPRTPLVVVPAEPQGQSNRRAA